MNWNAYIDAYCERLEPGLWAEPVNALTNAAFLIAAYIMWRRVQGSGLGLATALVVMLAVIGAGSFLYHTFATAWASTADVIPILGFILTYLYAANRAYLGWPIWAALAGVLGFIPYAAGLTVLIMDVPFLKISGFYWSVPVLIFFYAAILRRRAPATARGLALGGVLLGLSITCRSLDMPLCETLPMGTHFLWHGLNAVMLAWMIEVYRRHHAPGGLAGAGDRR